MKEIKIKTENPVKADEVLQNWGILMQGGGKQEESSYKKDKDGNYFARCLSGDTGFAKFAIENQGYSFMEIGEGVIGDGSPLPKF